MTDGSNKMPPDKSADKPDQKKGAGAEPDKTLNAELPLMTKTSVVGTGEKVISFDQTMNSEEGKGQTHTYPSEKSFNFGSIATIAKPELNTSEPLKQTVSESYEQTFDPDDSLPASELEVDSPKSDVKVKKPVHRFRYNGKGSRLFSIYFANAVLNIVSFGIFYFWGKTRVRKYNWSHFYLLKERFEYTGKGSELFQGGLKLLFLATILGGLSFGIGFYWPEFKIPAYATCASVGIFIFGYVQYSARSYRFGNTKWVGISLGMFPNSLKYALFYFLWTLSLPLTLGLSAPVRWIYLRKMMIENTYVGGLKLEYRSRIGNIWLKYYFSFLLTIATLGLYSPWHKANLMRWDASFTRFGSAKFKCVITGTEILETATLCFLLTLLTLGLGYPWAVVYWHEMTADSLAIVGDFPFNQIENSGDEVSVVEGDLSGALDIDANF